MARDPFEVLGIARDATLAEARAAYRRIAELFHPDRLEGVRADVRKEGERRMREAADAMQAIRSQLGRPLRAPGHEPSSARTRTAARNRTATRTVPRRRTRVTEAAVPTFPEHGIGGGDVFHPSDEATDLGAHTYDVELRTVGGTKFHVRWGGPHAAATLAALRHAHRIDGLIHQVEWGSYEVELDGAATRRLLCSVLTDEGWRRQAVEIVEAGKARAAIALGDLVELLDDGRRYSVLADVY